MKKLWLIAIVLSGCGKDQERIIFPNGPQETQQQPDPIPKEEPKPVPEPTPEPTPTPTPVPVPTPVPEPTKFPPLIEPATFQMNSAAVGHNNQNEAAQLTLASNIAKNAVSELLGALKDSKPEIRKENGQDMEVRKNNGYECYQMFVDNVQNIQIWKDGKKRMHSIRNFKTGAFKGVLIAGQQDNFSPIVSIFNPKGDGIADQIMIADIGNNQKDDIRGELAADAKTYAPKSFKRFLIFQGGFKAQAEGNALAQELGNF